MIEKGIKYYLDHALLTACPGLILVMTSNFNVYVWCVCACAHLLYERNISALWSCFIMESV